MEFGASARDTNVDLSISHIQIRNDNLPSVNEGESEVAVYIDVYSVFGIEKILSSSKDKYELSMGPRDESMWDSEVVSVSEKSNYMQLQFFHLKTLARHKFQEVRMALIHRQTLPESFRRSY